MLSLGCGGPQERTPHEINGAPGVWEGPGARGVGPSPVGAEDMSGFTPVARLGPLMAFSESEVFMEIELRRGHSCVVGVSACLFTVTVLPERRRASRELVAGGGLCQQGAPGACVYDASAT